MPSHPKSKQPAMIRATEPKPSNRQKNPDDWVTADEPMTGAQATYLKTLSQQARVKFDPTLSKAEASKRIDALQSKTRGAKGGRKRRT
jgi:hypothetical protein